MIIECIVHSTSKGSTVRSTDGCLDLCCVERPWDKNDFGINSQIQYSVTYAHLYISFSSSFFHSPQLREMARLERVLLHVAERGLLPSA
jgi:hypothetical protein